METRVERPVRIKMSLNAIGYDVFLARQKLDVAIEVFLVQAEKFTSKKPLANLKS
jgi:hypothetical protein